MFAALGYVGFEDAATSRRASDASSSSTPRVSLRGVIRYMFSPSSSALKAAGDTFAELRPASNAGSATGTAGVPAGDEGVPAGEMWDEGGGRGSTRERPSWSGGYSDAAAQAAERGCDQATGAADADVVAPERSTAQTLLSMVRPSFWRRADGEEDKEDGVSGGGGVLVCWVLDHCGRVMPDARGCICFRREVYCRWHCRWCFTAKGWLGKQTRKQMWHP